MEDEKIYQCFVEIRERLARIEQAVDHDSSRISSVENRINAALSAALISLLGFLWELIKK